MSSTEIYESIRNRNPLSFINFESPTITPEGSLNLTATWQGGDPTYEITDGFTFAILNGSQWVKLQGSGSTSGDRTIEAYFTVSEFTSWTRLFELGASDKATFINMSQMDSGSWYSHARRTAAPQLNSFYGSTESSPQLDELCHVVATWDSSTGQVLAYKNGELMVESYSASSFTPLTTSNELGNLFWDLSSQVAGSGNDKWRGSCAFVAYYNEKFDINDVRLHYDLIHDQSDVIDFVPMSEVPEDTVYPTGALVSTTVGTGLLNSNGSTVYIKTRFNISKGEVKHLISDDLSFNANLEFALDGTVTLTEGNIVTTGITGLDIIGITHQNGQLSLLGDDLVVILTSTLFNYNYAFPSVPLLDGETVDSVANPILNVGAVELLWHLGFTYGTPIWSNRETKAQANPQPEQLATLDAIAPIATTVVKNNPFYNDVVLDQQGNQRKFGYIASTTQVSGIPVGNKRVLLFTDDTALLIDETVSDNLGNYRFDSLLLNKKYMITAQYGKVEENTPPDYSATSVDWQSPTPYIEEV